MAVARQMNCADKAGNASRMQNADVNTKAKTSNAGGPHTSGTKTQVEGKIPEVLRQSTRVSCSVTETGKKTRSFLLAGATGQDVKFVQKGPTVKPAKPSTGTRSRVNSTDFSSKSKSGGFCNFAATAKANLLKSSELKSSSASTHCEPSLSFRHKKCDEVLDARIPKSCSFKGSKLSTDKVKPVTNVDVSGSPTKTASHVISNSTMSSNIRNLESSETERRVLPGPSEGTSEKLDKVHSPARTTPKLERHFSFELEEGCLVLAEETAGKLTEPQKERPVKPLRKNLPKVGSSALKRCIPKSSEGINSIFSEVPARTKELGIVGKKFSKDLAMDDVSGCIVDDPDSGIKKPKTTGIISSDKSSGYNVSLEASQRVNQIVIEEQGDKIAGSILKGVIVDLGKQDCFKEKTLDQSKSNFIEMSSIGIRQVDLGLQHNFNKFNGESKFVDSDLLKNADQSIYSVGMANVFHASSGHANNSLGVSEVRDSNFFSNSDSAVVETPMESWTLVNHDSPSKLVSQDSGIDTRETVGAPKMYPEYFSNLTQTTYAPRHCITLVNDYGDVSEDIGLEKLCKMVQGGEDDLIPKCEQYVGTFCNYQFDGEFGDVSEDLGINRFVREDAAPADVDRAPGFPGTSADSGMFVLDDPYIYDEDYAACNDVEDEEFTLDDELMMEVLCANRVNQMTRTYDDVEAMRRLLEEKEKDLELTARIGKELLERNQELKAQVQNLQAENRSAHESNTQLKHELHQKTQILHALTSDEDGSILELPSPVESTGKSISPILGPVAEGKISARESVARLKRKVDQLEQENKSLRQEATQLASETQLAEETEAILVEGVAQQLATAVDEKHLLENEVEKMRAEERRIREEMEMLIEKLTEAHKEIERLREENAMLSGKIQITTETQDRLAMELADFKEQYQEVSCLLTEAQENLRKVRQKSLPSALTGAHYLSLPVTRHNYYGNPPGDSIASELEISMISEMSLDSGIHMPEAQGRIPHYRKVFETYRSASRTSNSSSPLHRMPSTSSLLGTPSSFAQLSTASTLSASSMSTCRVSSKPSTICNASPITRGSSFSNEVPKHLYGNLPSTYNLDSAGQSEESDQSGIATDNEDCLYPGAHQSRGRVRDGVPGSPGAKELQAALSRLDRERQPQLTKGEKAIGGYEGKSRGSSVDVGPHRWSLSSSASVSVCQALPYGCRTPDSIMSTGSSRGSKSSWRMPERLMIMKIREGSQFLDEWSRLATPSLSAALEERPGVKVRGRMTDGVQQHNLMDFEEDDIVSESSEDTKSVSKDAAPIHPGKFFQSTNSVYTYTNSTVLHPDNSAIVPPSPLPQSPAPSSPSQQPTPLLSRRSSVSAATPTFSTALGLARMLHERGISASSSDNDLCKGHFTSATVTPCNSPDGSPFSSRSPSPEDANPIASLISSGAELLRRHLGGVPKGAGSSGRGGRPVRRNNRPPIGSLSKSDKKVYSGINLVEKLERIGLESLMQCSQPLRANQGFMPLTSTLQVGSMYARPMVKSPMAQLTSLKSTLRSRSREEPEEMDGPSPAKQKPIPCRRQDLGTVPTSVRKNPVDSASLESHTARGTISAIFFGRKGGLM